MSDQHRGAWGAREDAVWNAWGASGAADQNNLHHQQMTAGPGTQWQNQNQPHQQMQHTQQVVVQNQPQQTTSTVATQQLFSYKMASSFPGSQGVTVSASNAPAAYDYRLGMGTPQGMTTAPGTQWWYATAGQNTLDNLQQHQQVNHQIPSSGHQQVASQTQQPQQNQHNVHSTPNTVRKCYSFNVCKVKVIHIFHP